MTSFKDKHGYHVSVGDTIRILPDNPEAISPCEAKVLSIPGDNTLRVKLPRGTMFLDTDDPCPSAWWLDVEDYMYFELVNAPPLVTITEPSEDIYNDLL